MKYFFIAIFSSILLTACSEQFKTLDTKAFNEIIVGRTDIKTAEDLIKMYYDYPAEEGQPHLNISTTILADSIVEITLIHEGLEDDSQLGEKSVMQAKLINQSWQVLSIKENWRCRDGFGWSSWGTTPCN